VMEGVVTS